MQRLATAIVLMGTLSSMGDRPPASTFDSLFLDQTLRIDLFHAGDAENEGLTLDRLLRQGRWAGPRSGLVDPTPLGSSLVELRSSYSGEVLFRSGYDTLFGEYRTTGAAHDGVARTFHESALVPMPRSPAKVVFLAVTPGSTPRVLLERAINPADPLIANEPPAGDVRKVAVKTARHPAHAVDLVIVGEGYTDPEAFDADLERFAEVLLSHEPYASFRDDFAVTGLMPRSIDSGCDEPTHGVWRDTALSASFNSFGSSRYLLTEANRELRDVAANAPYDAIVIMVNHHRYGGGGILNLYSTFTSRNRWSEYLLLHEFGHSFTGLADEYYTSSVAYSDFYPAGTEPLQPNITALLDPASLKWRDLVADDVPLPTPWNKTDYDAADLAWQKHRGELNDQIASAIRVGRIQEEIAALEDALDRAAAVRADAADAQLSRERFAGTVGAFEGAGYASTGLYRPSIDCLMFSRGTKPLCPVCNQAVTSRIRHLLE
jgi:hypothetical protein